MIEKNKISIVSGIQHPVSSVKRITLILSTTFLFISGLFSACDDAFVDPFQNEDRFFTIYGYIDAADFAHEIRVIPVTRHQAIIRRPDEIQAALDAEVTISDLTTGEVIEWVYELEKLEDGTFAHIFRTEFLVLPGRSYRLDVTRSDGVRAWAITQVPHIPDSTLYDLGPVLFSLDSLDVTQDIFIPGDLNPWSFEAVYNWRADLLNQRVFVPYGRKGASSGITGWTTTMSLSDDQSVVLQNIRREEAAGRIADDTPLVLTGAGLRMTMLDKNWILPQGDLQVDEFTLPTTTTNINNGYGFFGSIGYYIQEWEACELSGPLGYEVAQPNCSARGEEE